MADPVVLTEMGEDELLAFADATAETVRRGEIDLLRVAYQWAVVFNAARLDKAESKKPGRESAKQLGGSGTTPVTEFAAAQLGARIGRSPYAAASLIGDAQDLHHRLPQLQGRVEAGEVRVSYARYVAAKTRDLSESEAGYVDAAVAESADGRITWTRFEALVEAKVAAAAPALARDKEQRRSKESFAKKTRSRTETKNGMGSFVFRADIASVEVLDAAVTVLAEKLLESMPDSTDDQRRVRAMLLLANPGAAPETHVSDLLPIVTLFVHVYAGSYPGTYAQGWATSRPLRFSDDEGVELDPETGAQDRIARVEGHGPVTEGWISRVLGPQARFKVQPVLDLAGQAPVDAYEIPDRHRQAVHLMTPADIFPFASHLSRTMQVDHTVPYDQGGESAVGNYGPMTLRHHRIKTHGGWQVQQPFPGIYVWRDPHGGFYLVDHTGTRRVRPDHSALTIEFHHHAIELDYQAA